MPSRETLRRRKGFYAWLAWYDGLADWREYGKRNPLVRPNVPANISRWRPTWFARREEWWQLRNASYTEPHNTPTYTTELWGVVRNASACPADGIEGRKFLALGGVRVLLQFRGEHDGQNRRELDQWARRWRKAGVRVDGWWRVNQSPSNVPPSVNGLDGWWPNAEDDPEIARLPAIYQSPCAGVLTKGKAPGAWPPANGLVGAECFRESAASDHTVANSVAWWQKAGLAASRIVCLVQAYGQPFAPLGEQIAEAQRLGVRAACVYPLDGADLSTVGRV